MAPAGHLVQPEPQDPRGGLSQADPPRRLRATRPLVPRRWRPRLTGAADAAVLDIVNAVALPLSTTVVCRHLVGVQAEDEASFRVRGHHVVRTLEPPNDELHTQLLAWVMQELTDPPVRTERVFRFPLCPLLKSADA